MYVVLFFFFFNDTATTDIYTLSLHDALPIWSRVQRGVRGLRRLDDARGGRALPRRPTAAGDARRRHPHPSGDAARPAPQRLRARARDARPHGRRLAPGGRSAHPPLARRREHHLVLADHRVSDLDLDATDLEPRADGNAEVVDRVFGGSVECRCERLSGTGDLDDLLLGHATSSFRRPYSVPARSGKAVSRAILTISSGVNRAPSASAAARSPAASGCAASGRNRSSSVRWTGPSAAPSRSASAAPHRRQESTG